MGWKNSLPIFSAVTKTITALANDHIQSPDKPPAHPLDDKAKDVVPTNHLLDDEPKVAPVLTKITFGVCSCPYPFRPSDSYSQTTCAFRCCAYITFQDVV